MARLIFAVLTVAAAMLIQPRSGEAEHYWPWCSHYDNPSDATSCAFATWEQCIATVRGIGGWCYANPYGPPPAPARQVRPSRRTSHG